MKTLSILLMLLLLAGCDAERRRERIMRKTVKDYEPSEVPNLRIEGGIHPLGGRLELLDANDFYFDYYDVEQRPFFLRLKEGQSLSMSTNNVDFYEFEEEFWENDNAEYPTTYDCYYVLRRPGLPIGEENPDSITLRLIAGDTILMRIGRTPLDIRLRDYSPRPIGLQYLVTLIVDGAANFRSPDIVDEPIVVLAGATISGDIFDVVDDTTLLVRGRGRRTCTSPPNDLYMFYSRVIRQQITTRRQAIELDLRQGERTDTIHDVDVIPWCVE